MLALVLTCRPHWRSWLDHQLAKQEHPHQLVVFDDSTKPQEWPGAVVIRPPNRLQLSLGEKRQLLLDHVFAHPAEFAWFDDDDWHPKERLITGERLIDDGVDAVGYESGIFCDTKTLLTRRLNTGDRLCFNSAVYAPHCAKQRFQPLHRGEDTAWNRGALASATIVSSPMMEHCWMSHDGNVTGKRGSMTFEGRRWARFDSFELEFLRKMQ